MAEGMNQMNQDELMLLDGFEQMAKALGAEIPIGLAEDLAAIRNGMPMSDNMRKTLAESSMRLGQQLKDQGVTPDIINGTNPEIMKDPMAGMQESGAITPDSGRVMSMEEAIAAGIVTPTRPQARPMMTSPRPQMRR